MSLSQSIASLDHLQAFYQRFCEYYAATEAELLQMALPKYFWDSEKTLTQIIIRCVDQLVAKSHLTKAGWKLYDWLKEQPDATNCQHHAGVWIQAGHHSAMSRQSHARQSEPIECAAGCQIIFKS